MEHSDWIGQVIDDRYRIIEPIGEGAMGSVYRAERLNLGRIVAIKVMNESLQDEKGSRLRFEREANAMAKLEHPHCASVLDIGVHKNRPYVVMDFVSGTNLTKLIDEGPVPIARAVEITRQVLSGLAHTHDLGIVHRDIKPANIVLSQKAGLGDHVKILDFGIARFSEESSNLTSGVILGTPSYMAPEQIRGIQIDGRADLYACGVMLFELLTAIKPFRSANREPIEVCMMQLNVPAPRLADKLAGRDFGKLEAIVARSLEKDRDQRYATAAEFANALSELGFRPSYQTPVADMMDYSAAAPTSRLSGNKGFATALVADIPTPSPATNPSLALPENPKSRRLLAIGAAAAVVGIAVAIAVAMRGGSSRVPAKPHPPITSDTKVVAVANSVTEADPVADIVIQADALAASGRFKPAIDLLTKSRRTYPKDARLPLRAGKLYVDKLFFADGIPLLRAAFTLDSRYRSDPDVIKSLLRGFNTTASYDGAIARFLREDVGPPAKPYLQETASSHPNPIVRNRAKLELKNY